MTTSIPYEQLDFGRFETRFLRVADSIDDLSKPANFNLLTASLNDPPRYNALSYFWGDVSKTEAIEVDGVLVDVSQSLVEALRNSGMQPGELVWADAICINQTDLYEKANQVRSMGIIYSKAARTIAWLGKSGGCSENALSFLKTFRKTSDSISLTDAFRLHRRPIPITYGLQDIIMRPYWERVWIIQEISKSTNLAILCGESQLDLDELLEVSHHLEDLPERNRDIMSAIAKFHSQEQRGTVDTPRMSLLEALLESRHHRATDPRDKIYALLGLTSDGDDIVPSPSYTNSVESIFENLTAAILATTRPTNLLLLAGWAPLRLKFPHASPWAVDWADLGDSLPPWMVSELPLERQVPSGIELPIRDSKIRSKGKYIGTIEQIEDYPSGSKAKVSSARRLDSHEAAVVMAGLRNNLVNAASSTEFLEGTSSDYLSRGLARMLRDAMTGHRSEKYNFDATVDILERLGSLVKGRFRFDQWGEGYDIHVRASLASKSDFGASSRQWEDILTKIDNLLEFGNRLATIHDGFVIIVGSKARVGDKVYRVNHSSLPVILRENPNGELFIVGEACLGVNEDLRGWTPAKDWLRSPGCILERVPSSRTIILDLGKCTPE
ncbi:hypothetical protein Hte_003523 [Hypoxylon texense]